MTASYEVGATFAPKQIIAGGTYTTRKVTIASGQNLIAGSVIGAILLAAAATVTVGTPVSGSGGTVGNGSIGTPTVDNGAPAGVWRVEITNAASNAGNFRVVRPDGSIDGVGTVAVAYNGLINFTLADGGNDWVEDDYIPITVAYDLDELEYKLSVAAATDGSQVPDLVMQQDVDATAGAKEGMTYETAQLVGSGLTLGAGHTIDSIREGFRLKGLTIS